MANTERRRHIRVTPEDSRPISIEINGDNFIESIPATDISVGGAAIVVTHQFADCRINRPVELVVTLPYPTEVSFVVTGRIKHITDDRFGVEFVDMSEKNLELIREYVRYRLEGASWQIRFKMVLGLY